MLAEAGAKTNRTRAGYSILCNMLCIIQANSWLRYRLAIHNVEGCSRPEQSLSQSILKGRFSAIAAGGSPTGERLVWNYHQPLGATIIPNGSLLETRLRTLDPYLGIEVDDALEISEQTEI